MKKLFLYTLAALALLATTSCKDDDYAASEGADRLMRPFFRTNLTIANGSNDPYLCKCIGRNSIQLYWSQIKGAKGYQLKASTIQGVATGDMTNWDNPDYLVLDTVLYGEEQDQLLLKDLKFSATYRFAIRALSADEDEHSSQWFGIGDLRHWADYCAIQTQDKYLVPSIIAQKGDIDKQSFKLYLDRSYAKSGNRKYTADELEEFDENYTTLTDASGNKVWKVDRLVIEPAATNPSANVPSEFAYPGKQLTADMFDADGMAELLVAGLDSNSVYNMYAYDETIAKNRGLVYAQYNLDITVRTKGDPGQPIVIEAAPQDTMHYWDGDQEKAISLPIAATPIQPLLEQFMKSNEYAENKVFYLEGGQTYFCTAGLQVFKGFKLATNPDDLAAGKGRAKVFLYHNQVLDISSGKSPSPSFFMLGRMPEGSENPMITIDIDKFQLEDIDFAIPYARNIADGSNVVTNSYFMNMYATGMGAVVEQISIKNCSFQGIVGGFYRVQANYGVRIKNFIIDNLDVYNGGYYAASGRRFNWFHANPEANKKINIWENFVMRNSTIYDNPLGYMFNHNKQQSIEWDDDLHYNITLENNTFINLNTCNSGNSMLFNTRWIPGGSTYTIKRNLFVLTRQPGDDLRSMVQAGADIRTINGSGTATFDFEDNYSTNDNLTNGQIFSASAFDANKNTFSAFSDDYITWGAAGREGLTVKVADISATDLMVQPNPPHKLGASANHFDHQEDGIDGTVTNPDATIRPDYVGGMVDLHFKNFNNVLVEKQIGAPKWRENK